MQEVDMEQRYKNADKCRNLPIIGRFCARLSCHVVRGVLSGNTNLMPIPRSGDGTVSAIPRGGGNIWPMRFRNGNDFGVLHIERARSFRQIARTAAPKKCVFFPQTKGFGLIRTTALYMEKFEIKTKIFENSH